MLKRLKLHYILPAILLGLAFLPVKSHAVPIYGGYAVVGTTGEVTATYIGTWAGYTNDLYLDAPANGLGIIFTGHTTPVGTTVSLGSFTAGTELLFRLYVRDTGDSFYTGPASRNPDGVIHAVVDDGYSPTHTSVGFEDLRGGGDQDYDDIIFAFTNVRGSTTPPTTSVPEPSTIMLVGAGLIGIVATRSIRRKQ